METSTKLDTKSYKQELLDKGLEQTLATLIKKPTIKTCKNGAHMAYFNLLCIDTDTNKKSSLLMSAYIKPESVGGNLEQFYESLKKGQMLSVEYKKNNGFLNINRVFLRTRKAK